MGFRPFLARLSRELGLTGHAENTTGGVEIEVQGTAEAVDAFRRGILERHPPMAVVLALEDEELAVDPGARRFEIRASRTDPIAAAMISPDIATCARCLEELFEPTDRRFAYPFLNCTDCGPRFSIVRGVPYDRALTSMAPFALCRACAAEYADLESRRFHAQPNACHACGPTLQVLGPTGERKAGDPLGAAAETLAAGGIVALMGVGGFHLACDATREEAVAELRRRKQRPAKPFAVMVADLRTARDLVELTADDAVLLAGAAAPIVLLPRRTGTLLAPSVAPGQGRLGLFLPYSPLHHLLLRRGFAALVMTSGNRSDEPIVASWEEARSKLAGVADVFLVHDREIVHRVDDSVLKSMDAAGPVVLRRARGYAPAPLRVANPTARVVLALGAELSSTVTVLRGDYAYVGPHAGDLKNLDVEEGFRRGAEHLLELLRVRPDVVACDLHPAYRSTRIAEEWGARGARVVRVQHHEAHAAACMAEHEFEGDALALALDGLGLGHDGTLWGGELLAGRPGAFVRLGHLVPVPLPGGDRAAREPWRMAASHLRRTVGAAWKDLPLPVFRSRPRQDLENLEVLLAKGFNAPPTSSCGRLFDAAAALCGFRGALTYSAQAAMELEALAASCRSRPAPCRGGAVTEREGRLVLDPADLLSDLLDAVLSGRSPEECSAGFHAGLARLLCLGAAEAHRRTGLRDVFLTGGCLQNAVLLRELASGLTASGLSVHAHRLVPPNDGGVSFGQAAWVARAGLGGSGSTEGLPKQ